MTNVAELPLFLSIGAGKAGFGLAVAAWAAGQIVGGSDASAAPQFAMAVTAAASLY